MPRPRYERPEDRAREAAALELLTTFMHEKLGWLFRVEKLPDNRFLDYRLWDDPDLICVVEIKGRPTDPPDAYPTWFVADAKAEAGFKASETHGVPFFLCFVWIDETFYLVAERRHVLFRKMGGNLKRHDGMGDWELMAHFDPKDFTSIGRIKLPGNSPLRRPQPQSAPARAA